MLLETKWDTCFTLLGDDSRGGAYLLRMWVERPLSVVFGRFKQGQPIDVPAGTVAYIGSALGKKGSSSLARRLLRHASRHAAQRPHSIQAYLVEFLAATGLSDGRLPPPARKTLRWHVDYLLEETGVNLDHIVIIRSETPLEKPLARLLAADSATSPLVPGLGATDNPGYAHLLRIPAESTWWTALPAKIERLLPADGR